MALFEMRWVTGQQPAERSDLAATQGVARSI